MSNEDNPLIGRKEFVLACFPIALTFGGYLTAIEPRLAVLEDHDASIKSAKIVSRIAVLEGFKSRGERFTELDAEKAFNNLKKEQIELILKISDLQASVIRNESRLNLIAKSLEK